MGPNHPSNVARVLNLHFSCDFCYLLTKHAPWTTISDRKFSFGFFSLKYNLWRHTGWSHQNRENYLFFFFYFLSETYIIWTSIRRGAKHRKLLFHTTRMSRVMGYFSAPPGSIVFLKQTIALVLTILYKISRFFGTTNLSLWTKIVWFYIFIFWLNNTYLNSTKKDHVTFSDVTNLFSGIPGSWKFLFFLCLFSFSFRRSICLICNLNSEGNLTRKHLNLELFPEGGFQVLFYRFIQIQTAISQLDHIWDIAKKIQLLTPFFQIFQKKQKNKKTKKLGNSKNLKFT